MGSKGGKREKSKRVVKKRRAQIERVDCALERRLALVMADEEEEEVRENEGLRLKLGGSSSSGCLGKKTNNNPIPQFPSLLLQFFTINLQCPVFRLLFLRQSSNLEGFIGFWGRLRFRM